MKTIDEILGNYADYETFIEDRFGARLCNFLSEEQVEGIGFSIKEGCVWPDAEEWTEENILKQLKDDVLFGWEKACNHRGISSELMYCVVSSWNKVLENKLSGFKDYTPYGTPLFIATAKLYGWDELDEADFNDGDWS